MGPRYFIGVDISKLTVDIAVVNAGEVLLQKQVANEEKEIKKFIVEFRKMFPCKAKQAVVCAEKMRVFGMNLISACRAKRMPLYLESALQIKRSMGIVRGKTDSLDAVRIAEYARRHFPSLRLFEPPRFAVDELTNLMNIRKRLVAAKNQVAGDRKQVQHFYDPADNKRLQDSYKLAVEAVKENIETIEQQIFLLLDKDSRLKELTVLITSVPCIGKITAAEIISRTNEFKAISSAKKFASYCGIAPFPYSSGTGLKAKMRVSGIGNRKMKALLHIAAMRVVREGRTSFALYHKRKVGEGKSRMSVMNAIRNKLIHAIFRCVNSNTKYQDLPKHNSALVPLSH